LIEAAAEAFPKTDWQRCTVHFYRNVFSHAPNNKVAEVARTLKAIHAQEDRAVALTKSKEVVARLKAMLKGGGFSIEHIGLRLEASVPGMDEATFQKIAAKAKQDCPLSKALASVPEITLTAILR